MTDTLETPLARGSHTTRPYSVVTECLRIQASARRQSRLARLFGRSPILPDARSSFLGARGEIQAAKALVDAGPAWTVLYPLALDAPALLIGTAGVFAVFTKNHSRQRVWVGDDQLLVNGHRTHHLWDARHDSQAIGRMLGITVAPVLAIVDPAHFVINQRPDGVEVLAASQLATWISRRKPRLTDDAVTALLTTPGLRDSWSADVPNETLRHEARFARLVAEVESAARRRLTWILAAGVVLVSLVVAVTLVH